MAGSFGSGDDEVFSSINVTPLVDVVLVLLIIFMITAPAIYQSSIKLQLPKSKTGEQSSEKSALTFMITKDGALTWDKQPQDWNTLGQKLRTLALKPEDVSQKTAIISADQATPHGTVIRLMDALREVGMVRFALNVEPNVAK